MLQGDLDLAGALLVDAEAGRLHRPALQILGQRRHVVLGEDLVGEVPVLLRDHRLEVGELGFVAAALPDVGHRHDDVSAVRLAVDVLVDPGQLDVELVRRVGERAEHAEASGAAHGRDDVAAMGEREDRELDPEILRDRRLHAP